MNPTKRRRNYWPDFLGTLAVAVLAWYAFKGAAPTLGASADQPHSKLALRTLIVSGGPSVDYNQYAIESNARYVEHLTAGGRSQRVLFTDGNPDSCTIPTYEDLPDDAARKVFAWLFNDESVLENNQTVHRPTLTRIDGATNLPNVLDYTKRLTSSVAPGEHGLLFFVGHGSYSKGNEPPLRRAGRKTFPSAYQHSTYSLWGDKELTVPQLAGTLKSLPPDRPLALVMVQCYSGGFANLIFKDAVPGGPVLPRDFCGFFSATGDREAAGCTDEVNEENYQDFTTHFFAALSGEDREGDPVTGADYDRDGTVSMLEAFAWANIHDESIDVPMCTSDLYLRQILPVNSQRRDDWPFSKLLRAAEPWQKAIILQLAEHFHAHGENTLQQMNRKSDLALADINLRDNMGTAFDPPGADRDKITRSFRAMLKEIQQKFPDTKLKPTDPKFVRIRAKVLEYLSARPQQTKFLADAYDAEVKNADAMDTREAMLWRFLRTCRTVILQDQLKRTGTPLQKATLAKLRRSESRNPLK